MSPGSCVPLPCRWSRVEVADLVLVLRARQLTWPWEIATTPLATRPTVFPLKKLLILRTPTPATSSPILYPEVPMARRKTPTDALPVLNPHTAAIDIHAAVHWVAVPPNSAPPDPSHPPELPPEVRSFGACTADLEQIADWLTRCGVKSVAMESTGIYWIALF